MLGIIFRKAQNKVQDPAKAVINVEDYRFAMLQVAQTSLRSIIGKSDLDDLLSNREHLNQGLELMIDTPALAWGIDIDRVEIKDVALPESMKRSMSRQAEAERERRARIITADGELQASKKLSEAAGTMESTPGALQLRLLQTIVEVAAEKNSTLVLPFPVEMLRYFEAEGEVLEVAVGDQLCCVRFPAKKLEPQAARRWHGRLELGRRARQRARSVASSRGLPLVPSNGLER